MDTDRNYMVCSRRALCAGLGSLVLSCAASAYIPDVAYAADPYRVVRLANWDAIPPASIFINPKDVCLGTLTRFEASGDFRIDEVGGVRWAVFNPVIGSDHTYNGTIHAYWSGAGVDIDGALFDIDITISNVRTKATSYGTQTQGVMCIRSSSCALDSEPLPNPYGHISIPQSQQVHVRLIRPDGSLAKGRYNMAMRDIDIDSGFDDAYSESVYLKKRV